MELLGNGQKSLVTHRTANSFGGLSTDWYLMSSCCCADARSNSHRQSIRGYAEGHGAFLHAVNDLCKHRNRCFSSASACVILRCFVRFAYIRVRLSRSAVCTPCLPVKLILCAAKTKQRKLKPEQHHRYVSFPPNFEQI